MTHEVTEPRTRQGEATPVPPEPGAEAPCAITARRRVYEIMEGVRDGDRVADAFDAALVLLILANVVAFMAETVPSLRARYGIWFDVFEVVSVGLFTVEYLLRLWIAVEVPFLRQMPAWKARLAWARRPYMIVDLLAILPSYLQFLLGFDLRIVRLLRVLRLLKLSRYSPAMHTLARVVYGERRALVGAVYLLVAAVIFASTGIYYFEHQVQPEKFGSVPESAWWAIATLTTVGYGDVVPITPLGKMFGAVVMVTGLCILALPVAIISTGFAREVGRWDFVINWSLMSRVPLLADLDADQVAEIMPLFHALNTPPRTEVVRHGAPGQAMYFIASGEVEFVSDLIQRSYRTGDCFGLVAILENDTSYGMFQTVGWCRLLKLYKEDFRRLEHIAPAVARQLRSVALDRVRERERAIAVRSAQSGFVAAPEPVIVP